MRHAKQCLQLSEEVGDRQSAFDRAVAHACAATAYQLAGRKEDAENQRVLADRAADELSDPADREVFGRLYPVSLKK